MFSEIANRTKLIDAKPLSDVMVFPQGIGLNLSAKKEFANARATRIKLLVHGGFAVRCTARSLNQSRFMWPRDVTGAASSWRRVRPLAHNAFGRRKFLSKFIYHCDCRNSSVSGQAGQKFFPSPEGWIPDGGV